MTAGIVYAYIQVQSLSLLALIGMGTAPVAAQLGVLCLLALAASAMVYCLAIGLVAMVSLLFAGPPGGGDGAGGGAGHQMYNDYNFIPFARPVGQDGPGYGDEGPGVFAQAAGGIANAAVWVAHPVLGGGSGDVPYAEPVPTAPEGWQIRG